MSDDVETQVAEHQDAESQTAIDGLPDDVKAKLEELDRIKAHHEKLLGETKAAKQRAQELEAANKEADAKRRQAEEERLKKEGEFQKLYESESERAARIEKELETERAERRQEAKERQQREIENSASKLMLNVAVDDSSLEILAEKAQQYAVFTENGVEYEIGGVKVTQEKVIETLTNKYPRLVKGSGATGGGAAGTQRPSGADAKNQASEDAKKKGDLTGFITAQLKT